MNTHRSDESPVEHSPEERSWVRRHRIVTSLIVILALFLAGVAGFAFWVNSSLGDIERIPIAVDDSLRPAPSEGDGINVLLLGTDAGSGRNTDGQSILDDAASGDWPTGKYRSDATMIAHIPADRGTVTVMSIPRDSYVTIHDRTGRPAGQNKINAALSLHGPSGALATVENLTDLRIDHVAMIDWDGFQAITDALGGVEMTTDTGRREFDGAEALEYVRERYTVEGGDFGRIDRQQNFMRAVMAQLLTNGTMTNPVKLTRTVRAVTQNLAVDEDWSNGDIRSLALSMRSVRSADVRFLTVPVLGTDMVDGASIVRLDDARFAELFAAVGDDSIDRYLEANGDLMLPPAEQVD